MNIKKLYYYWFYKYYSFLEKYDQTRWLSQTKALIIMSTLEIWAVGTLYIYAKMLAFKYADKINLSTIYWFIPTCVIIIIKWVAFNEDFWKKYVEEFDRWDAVNNNRGNWIVAFITVGIFLNFLCAGIVLRNMYGWPT